MHEGDSDIIVVLSGMYGRFVEAEADAVGRPPAEVVQRAIALYAILGQAIESGQQIVLQYIFEATPEPVIRIDHLMPPFPTTDLAIRPSVRSGQRTHAELAGWPPVGD